MKKNQSMVSKRRNEILAILKRDKNVKNEELAELLHTSPLTIRRDLQALEDEGLVKRYYGGATLLDEPSILETTLDIPKDRIKQKHAIAKYAASLIDDGDTIFINTSSTALLILEYLENKRVVVVTNNGKALQVPLSSNIDLVLTGGQVYGRKQSMIGDFATFILSKISASKCFLGVSGIEADCGITTSVLQETLVNKEMINHSIGPVYIVTDSTKIEKHSNFSSGDIDKISHLITDSDVSEEDVIKFTNKGIKVTTVDY
ncbi:DeoR/GlpR family DNA-binding transcription regulator [Clostridium saudiense]|uniref:DeoR/GlpR family DNA-binding transcription regulator n=1 Tax=Clostridium saudiense TaxID=1414720 RepID=UPI0018AA56B6|nr:DeoR/GlpR family DNA-binding transcription regulator [Clostridium saudiense]